MKFIKTTPKAIPVDSMFALVFKKNNVNTKFRGKEDRLNLFKIYNANQDKPRP